MNEFFPFIYEKNNKKNIFEHLYIEIDKSPIQENNKKEEKEDNNESIYIIQL
tara:strand:+ start:581 stop:736 length:156 start_codon:yes stop_codon:yes gene_type:complete